MTNIPTVGYTTKEEQDAYIALPAVVKMQLLNGDWDTAHAMNTAHDNALNLISDSRNTPDNPERERELTFFIRQLLDTPGCFYNADIVKKAGITPIESGGLSKTEPQCAEDPEQPGNWHYNQAGTLALEKFLQDTYPELNIRLPNEAEMSQDIVSLRGNAVGIRLADHGVVVNRDYSYFRFAGGVGYVGRLPSGVVIQGRSHPAFGMSVRFRRG